MKTCKHIIVRGVVQGVGYRYYCRNKAHEYDIKGFARNMPDGTVQIMATGDNKRVSTFLEDLKVGPFAARVEELEVCDVTQPEEFAGFGVL